MAAPPPGGPLPPAPPGGPLPPPVGPPPAPLGPPPPVVKKASAKKAAAKKAAAVPKKAGVFGPLPLVAGAPAPLPKALNIPERQALINIPADPAGLFWHHRITHHGLAAANSS